MTVPRTEKLSPERLRVTTKVTDKYRIQLAHSPSVNSISKIPNKYICAQGRGEMMWRMFLKGRKNSESVFRSKTPFHN